MAVTVPKMPCSFPTSRLLRMDGVPMATQSTSHMSCGIIPAADCLPACLEATARSYRWHLPSLEMREARSSGRGMALTAMWHGVPALPAGVGIRQDSSRAARCQNFHCAMTESHGSRARGNGRAGDIPQHPEP